MRLFRKRPVAAAALANGYYASTRKDEQGHSPLIYLAKCFNELHPDEYDAFWEGYWGNAH